MKYTRYCRSLFIALAGLLLTGLTFSSASAQFVDLGQDPASTRWRQIKTDDFQIIYPDFFEEQAQYIANLYAKLYDHSNSMGVRAKKMSMVIRARGGISNGNAGWAPKKSELYTTPPQDPDDSWLQHLCIHEFRHVVQYDKVNQGLSKVLYHLFGEQYTMALIGVYIPMWLLEGDATVFETALEAGGRGRSPEFLNEMKAQIVEKGRYYYYKAVLGSFKDYVPGRYNLGYYMVGNSRRHYGSEIWQDVFERVGRRPFGIRPVNKSIRLTLNAKRDSLWSTPRFQSLFVNPDSIKKANTNSDAMRELYRDNFTELYHVWKEEVQTIEHRFDTINTAGRLYANYHYPIPLGGGKIMAYKEGLAEEGAFVVIENGKEKIVFRPGILYDYKYAFHNNTLVWSEYKAHPRWEHGGKMTLATFDLNERNYKRHPAPSNRFSPFPVGDNWGFVEVDHLNYAYIVIMDKDFERELFRLKAGAEENFIHPSFNGVDEIISVVVSPSGKWLETVNINSGKRQALSPKTNYEIDNPLICGNELFFRGAFNGNNALYNSCGNESFGEHILEAQYGIRYPSLSPEKDSLHFSFYTSDGYKPGKIALQDIERKKVEQKQFAIAEHIKETEKWTFSLNGTDSLYTSRKYRKGLRLFNVHSWGPFFPDREDLSIQFGFAVSSQNKLSTLYWTAGYVWDGDYDKGCWKLKATYKGLWPVLSVEYRDGKSSWQNLDLKATHIPDNSQDTVIIINDSRYTRFKGSLQFPFTLNSRNYYRKISPFITYELHAIHKLKPQSLYRFSGVMGQIEIWNPVAMTDYTFSNPRQYLQVLQYGFTAYNQTRMSQRDLNPRWGQWIEMGYEHTPFKTFDYGDSWWGEGMLYFPGICKHHSLYAYAGYQKRSLASGYGNQISSPRGTKLYGKEIFTLQSGYKMPLAYPDYHMRSFAYVKRIVGGVFFDTGKENKQFYSYGLEAVLDTHFFTLTFPVNIGIRAGYETKTDKMFINAIFSIGLSI